MKEEIEEFQKALLAPDPIPDGTYEVKVGGFSEENILGYFRYSGGVRTEITKEEYESRYVKQ